MIIVTKEKEKVIQLTILKANKSSQEKYHRNLNFKDVMSKYNDDIENYKITYNRIYVYVFRKD